jgi:hypothetical protein
MDSVEVEKEIFWVLRAFQDLDLLPAKGEVGEFK